MRVRIRSVSGYGDRFGGFHRVGSVCDLPAAIAVKIIRHGIATAEPDHSQDAVQEPATAISRRTAKTNARRAEH